VKVTCVCSECGLTQCNLQGTLEYLTNISTIDAESDLVFMVDALDVWLQLSPRTLIERFEELGTSGVVIGADKFCWPNEWESSACQDAPESTLPKGVYGLNDEVEGNGMPHTRPRWANSGTVLGSVAAMRTLYKELADVLQQPEWKGGSDQAIFNILLASRRLSLDYHSRLFWTTAFASPESTAHFLNTPYHIDTFVPHELYPPMLHQAQTGEVPVAIHITNSQLKHLRQDWWGKLWWNKLDDKRFRSIVSSRVDGAVVGIAGGGSKQWTDICPKDILGL